VETRFCILLLIVAACLATSGCAVIGGGGNSTSGATSNSLVAGTAAPEAVVDTPADDSDPTYALVYEPDVNTREVREARIDTENFEVGAFGGVMSIEDFGTNPVYGARAAYHITQTLFAEATYGITQAGRTSFEELSGGAELLLPDERKLTYYNLSFGLNLFPGEVFFGRRRAFNSALYLTGGAGATEFAGDSRFTVTVGLGYRFFAMDWLALHATVRDHIFDIDLLGEAKTTHNLETHAGFTVFF
jgi:outer membrane beta-barrel protein